MESDSVTIIARMWLTAALCIVLYALWKFVNQHWWKPTSLQRTFERQGIRGSEYTFFSGDVPQISSMVKNALSHPMQELSHDIMPRVLPHYSYWSKLYGQQFVHWHGSMPQLTIPDPEVMREALSMKLMTQIGKSPRRADAPPLGGNGLGTVQGEAWAIHRRVVSPAFHMDKLKAMTPVFVECAASMLGEWHRLVSQDPSGRCEIDVSEYFRTLTADIIARTAFGSSYGEGKRVFELQQDQVVLIAQADLYVYIPGSRFLPTPKKKRQRMLEEEIKGILEKMIQKRLSVGRSDLYGNDLLGILLASNSQESEGNADHQKNSSLSTDDIIDECKTFFFAGNETTSNSLAWTTLLLAQNPYWQEKARAEVLAVYGTKPPTVEGLNQLKIVTMVLNESLRLYPPAVYLMRHVYEDVRLGNLNVPKGSGLILPILAMHHDPDIWGDDVHEFKPQRFAEGAANAAANKQPLAFMPFSTGPRFCVGQNFALLEAKTIIAAMLQRFSFGLSPAYRHAPLEMMTLLRPQYGVQVIISSL